MPLLLGLGMEEGGNDYLSYLLFQQAGESGDTESKRFQTLLLAPLARKFTERLARKIQSLSDEGRAKLLAALVAFTLSTKQDGDMANLLDLVSMNGIMSLFNSSNVGISTTSLSPQKSADVGVIYKGKIEEKPLREEIEEVVAKGAGGGGGKPKKPTIGSL